MTLKLTAQRSTCSRRYGGGGADSPDRRGACKASSSPRALLGVLRYAIYLPSYQPRAGERPGNRAPSGCRLKSPRCHASVDDQVDARAVASSIGRQKDRRTRDISRRRVSTPWNLICQGGDLFGHPRPGVHRGRGVTRAQRIHSQPAIRPFSRERSAEMYSPARSTS